MNARSVGAPVLLVATGNEGKRREIERALAGLGVQVRSLRDLPGYAAPAETGETYVHNALLKAQAALAASGLPVLADDSGLEVDALDGAPGVHSTRFGGPGLTDEQRNTLLLQRLAGVPRQRRTARFRAVLVLLAPGAAPELFEGTVDGWIGFEPRGSGGFGYDPIFYLRDADGRLLDRTMAELTPNEKNAVSHRGRALALLRQAFVDGRVRLA